MKEKVLCLFNKRFSIFNKDRLSCGCNKALIAYEALTNADNLNQKASDFIKDKTGIDVEIELTQKYEVVNIFKSPYYVELKVPSQIIFTISPQSSFSKYSLLLGGSSKGSSSVNATFGTVDPSDNNKIVLNGATFRDLIVSNFLPQTGSAVLMPFEVGGSNIIRMLLDPSSYHNAIAGKVVLIEIFEGIINETAFQNIFNVTNRIEPALYSNLGSNTMSVHSVVKNNTSEYKFMVKKGDSWVDKSEEVNYDQWGLLGNWSYYGEDNYSEWRIIDDVDERVVKSGLLEELG